MFITRTQYPLVSRSCPRPQRVLFLMQPEPLPRCMLQVCASISEGTESVGDANPYTHSIIDRLVVQTPYPTLRPCSCSNRDRPCSPGACPEHGPWFVECVACWLRSEMFLPSSSAPMVYRKTPSLQRSRPPPIPEVLH